jgi:hypothetical protein
MPAPPVSTVLTMPRAPTCRTSQRRQGNVRVLGLSRPLFVALVGLAALYCLYRSRGWLNLVLALLAGEAGRGAVSAGGGGGHVAAQACAEQGSGG